MERRLLPLLLILLIATITLSPLLVSACASPADRYAIEVLLNKPGISYDLSKLAGEKGVSTVKYFGAYSAYIYRSHRDDRLIVLLSEQGLRYAQAASSEGPAVVIGVSGSNVNDLESKIERIDTLEKVRELGWNVQNLSAMEGTASSPPVKSAGFIFAKDVDSANVSVFLSMVPVSGGRCTVKLGLLVSGVGKVDDELASKIESEIGALLDELGLSKLRGLLKSDMIKRALLKKIPEQEKYLAVRVQIPLVEEVSTATVHVCNIERLNLSKFKPKEAEKVGWRVLVKEAPEDNYTVFVMMKNFSPKTGTNSTVNLIIEGEKRGNEVHLSLRVEGPANLSSSVLEEFKEALERVGLDEGLVSKCSFRKFEEPKKTILVPAYKVSDEEIREVLRAELRYLSEKGVISGLSEKDIESIVSAAKLGYAGWNRRLVWFNGKWVPYDSMNGAMVLRCFATPPSFFLLGKPGEVGSGGLNQSQEIITDYHQSGLLRPAVPAAIALSAMLAGVVYLIWRRSSRS